MSHIGSIAKRRAASCLLTIAVCVATPLANATVTCTINSLSSAAFGIYNPFSATALDSVASASISCSGSGGFTETASLTITASAGTAGTFSPRQMQGPGANLLNYNLYIDAARTQIFGTGASGTFADARSATVSKHSSTTFTETIYARIPAAQDVAVGSYSDVLIYTINF